MEESLVSVPSNTDAAAEEVVLSLVEGGKLTSPLMKQYGVSIREHRPKSAQVGIDLKLTVNGKEIQDGIHERSGETEGGKAGGTDGTSKQEDDSSRESKEAAGKAKSEDAEGSDSGAEVETYQCECLACGHKAEFTEHCRDVECPECGGEMRRAERPGPGASSGAEVKEEAENEPEQTKQGRVLSKSNEAKIVDAVEAINEVVGMDIPRPAKATLREASTGLGQVLKVLDADEEPKQVNPSMQDAITMVIFQTTKKQRNTLLETLEVIKRNEKQKETAEEVRSLLGA